MQGHWLDGISGNIVQKLAVVSWQLKTTTVPADECLKRVPWANALLKQQITTRYRIIPALNQPIRQEREVWHTYKYGQAFSSPSLPPLSLPLFTAPSLS